MTLFPNALALRRAIAFSESILIAGLAAGCSGGSQGSAASVTKSASTLGGLTLTLTESQASITPGQSVSFTLTLTNTSNAPITYTPEGGCSFTELIAGTSSSVDVANTSANLDYQFASQYPSNCTGNYIAPVVKLAPGASLTASVGTGTALTQAGIYTASAKVAIYVGDATVSPATGANQNLAVGPLQIVVQ